MEGTVKLRARKARASVILSYFSACTLYIQTNRTPTVTSRRCNRLENKNSSQPESSQQSLSSEICDSYCHGKITLATICIGSRIYIFDIYFKSQDGTSRDSDVMTCSDVCSWLTASKWCDLGFALILLKFYWTNSKSHQSYNSALEMYGRIPYILLAFQHPCFWFPTHWRAHKASINNFHPLFFHLQ